MAISRSIPLCIFNDALGDVLTTVRNELPLFCHSKCGDQSWSSHRPHWKTQRTPIEHLLLLITWVLGSHSLLVTTKVNAKYVSDEIFNETFNESHENAPIFIWILRWFCWCLDRELEDVITTTGKFSRMQKVSAFYDYAVLRRYHFKKLIFKWDLSHKGKISRCLRAC